MKKEKQVTQNIVAKFANKFNHARVFRDRKNDYKRTNKHKGRVPYDLYVLLLEYIGIINLTNGLQYE